VRGSGRRVTEIQTSFNDTAMFWPNSRWRIDLERYNCNPIGRTKAQCPTVAGWHGKTRTGIRTPGNRYPPQVRFAQSRSNGYWSTLSLPHTFRSNGWLCTEVAVYNSAQKEWVYNAAGLTRGSRACVSVHR
jgi:hypothetical protein